MDGLIFDLGDVLYDATQWRRWLLHLLGEMGVARDPRQLAESWKGQYLSQAQLGRCSFSDALRSFLLSTGLPHSVVDEVQAASLAQQRLEESDVRLFRGVLPTLRALRAAGVKLAALDNSILTRNELVERLRHLGLHGLFEIVASSRDLGRRKPQPEAYLSVLERLGTTPPRTAFVGHDGGELAGAHSVGIVTIAFNPDPEVRADRVAGRFEELLTLATRPWNTSVAG
jgi:HAD superfamily hydrolase (TIGR01509 family)